MPAACTSARPAARSTARPTAAIPGTRSSATCRRSSRSKCRRSDGEGRAPVSPPSAGAGQRRRRARRGGRGVDRRGDRRPGGPVSHAAGNDPRPRDGRAPPALAVLRVRRGPVVGAAGCAARRRRRTRGRAVHHSRRDRRRMSRPMHRRDAIRALVAAAIPLPQSAGRSVSTLIGTGVGGYSETQVDDPYGFALGRDGALYSCDLGNQRIRRIDRRTRRTVTVAGTGERGYAGDGGAATAASLNMPHEIQFDAQGRLYIAERDNHVVRRVDLNAGVISTFAGTGRAGFSGDGGPAAAAELRQPHSIAVEPDGRALLVCDIGNHRLRRIDFVTGTIETIGGTGERQPTPDGAVLKGTPLNGPRTIAFDASGTLYLALREGNAIYAVDPRT